MSEKRPGHAIEMIDVFFSTTAACSRRCTQRVTDSIAHFASRVGGVA